LLTYLTGWFDDPDRYNALLISGGSADGKTHLKQSVVDTLFTDVPDKWLYNTTSASGLAMQDDESWDECRFANLDEMNKLEHQTIEFLKSVYGEDGGSTRTRNVADADAEGGFDATRIERDPKPFCLLFADENPQGMDWELATRLMEVKVDATREKNMAVGKATWGHSDVELPSDGSGSTYMFDTDVTDALRQHVANLPTGVDVKLPDDADRYGWEAWPVVKPIFKWKRSDSTRAARMISNLVRASALFNCHNRDTEVIDGETVIVADPQDLANVLSCRKTLLTTTHELSDKKFAVVDAIRAVGGYADQEGRAKQAPLADIRTYLQESWGGSTIDKSQLRDILTEMAEHYVVDVNETEDETYYVYRGGERFGHPNVTEYDVLAETRDPIRSRPLTETVAEHRAELGARSGGQIVSDEPDEDAVQGGGRGRDGQATLTDPTDADDPSDGLSDVTAEVRARLYETMNGVRVPVDALESVEYEHMIGVTPLDSESGGDGLDTTVEPARPPTDADRRGTLFDPQHEVWNSGDTLSQMDETDVRQRVRAAVEECRDRELLTYEQNDDETVTIHVTY
jgi:hypothetical protein